MFLLVESALFDKLAQSLPAALQAMLLLVELAVLDQLVKPLRTLSSCLGMRVRRLEDGTAVGRVVVPQLEPMLPCPIEFQIRGETSG